jgi:hypothetical protein
MAYSPRLTIDDYVLTVLRADFASLPPRKPGCYSVWHSDFDGPAPQDSDKDQIVLVGKTESTGAELLYRVTCLVLDAIGMTGAGNKPGTKYSFFYKGGRDIFLHHGNVAARKPLVTWRDDVCPSCEEHRIYAMFAGGRRLLNVKPVGPCPKHP